MILLVPIFAGDGRWYRALVLQASQSVVKVLYADYGNTETLPLSEVLPITDSYLKLPFQTIICSLAGKKTKQTKKPKTNKPHKKKQNQKNPNKQTKNEKKQNQKTPTGFLEYYRSVPILMIMFIP